jgi:hypothetical protein
MQFERGVNESRDLAEGVGFEPTVGFKPTLDFESSALNRTQPPFLGKRKRPTLNVQYRTSNAMLILTWDVGCLRWLDHLRGPIVGAPITEGLPIKARAVF